jgi:hypothetical protein
LKQMRAPWLHRWQDVVCLVVAGAFAVLSFIGGGIDGFLAGPYVAGVAFIATWVIVDFLIALSITRHERREQAKAAPPKPPPAKSKRQPLPRAVARRAPTQR